MLHKISLGVLAGAVLAGAAAIAPAGAELRPWGQGVVLVPPAVPANRAAVPGFARGKITAYASNMAPGSIVIDTRNFTLYYVIGGSKAVKFRIAAAKRGYEWSGTHRVSLKVKWPAWRPPEQMRKRRPELPDYMAGGRDNPLGARAIYLGSSIYRIHGTNEPASIGKPVSSGCIRMLNEDVSELYRHVQVGAVVTVF